ncbi:MAG: peptidylprolyl isomerase [Candidatus Gastranaerophilales bacterium]|nr:peptidylprolyl isomerase [Candidatus Gastranaerophilales bacterium]
MKFTKLAIMCLCSTVLFCACAKNPNAVIKVNDKEITKKEFYTDFNKIKNLQLKDAPKEMQADDSYAVLSIKARYVNDVIIRELLNQEFAKRKIEATQEEIEAKKAQIIAQIGSEEQFKKILKENKISDERLNSDMASEVKMEKLVNIISGPDTVTDKEAQKYYNENKPNFEMPERVKVSHILIDTNADSIKRKITEADKEAKLSSANIDEKVKQEVEKNQKLLKEVYAKAVANPKNFAALAKEYSQDPSAQANSGDLGFIVRGQMVKEFEDAAFSYKVGVVGPIVKSQFGEHIILVQDKAAPGLQPFSAVKEDLKKFLSNQKKFVAVQKLIEGLKASATIEYIEEGLNPEALEKQIQEALPRQIEAQQNAGVPKSKVKKIQKIKKIKKEKDSKK